MNYLYEYSDILNTPYEAFVFDTLINEKFWPVRSHFHPYVEVIHMLEGNMFATVDDKEYYLGQGDTILFFRDTVHSMSASSLKGAKFAGIKFDANRLTVNAGMTPKLSILLTAARDQGARIFFDEGEGIENDFGSFFKECIRELEVKDFGYDLSVHARLCLFMLTLMRIWQDEGIDFSRLHDYVGDKEITMQNILEYIDLHMDEDLRVDELAKRCSMSYSHFARSFKEMYGRSCKEHLKFLRVGKAEEMLRFTDQSLDDISQELGYSDQSHFIREYKSLKGMTPGSVRGRVKEGRV